MELEIVSFIKNNPAHWKELLQDRPYHLKIKEKDSRILFKYNLLYSDFNFSICREARGLILEKDTWKVLRCAFFKFFNYGESQADDIDVSSMQVQEKLDGSLISLYFYDGVWQVATNGCIDARDALTEDGVSFYRLFLDATTERLYNLDTQYTYTFELVGPYNRVVVPYSENKLYHIGTRNNLTLQETNKDITGASGKCVAKPITYSIINIEDVVKESKNLPYDEEGYVCVDKYFNRVKIKSPAYVAAHHLKSTLTGKTILRVIRAGEKEEVLLHFPEWKEYFEEIENKYKKFCETLDKDIEEAKTLLGKDRITFAAYAKTKKETGMLFMVFDGKINNAQEYVDTLLDDKLFEKIRRI